MIEATQWAVGVDELIHVPVYAFDTELHTEDTYWSILALIQIAWRG